MLGHDDVLSSLLILAGELLILIIARWQTERDRVRRQIDQVIDECDRTARAQLVDARKAIDEICRR